MRFGPAALLGLALVSALASRVAVESYDDDRASLVASPAPAHDDTGPEGICWAAILPVAPAPADVSRVLVAAAPAPAPAPPLPAPLHFAPKTSPPRT